MDPVTAFSLAAGVLQVIDLAFKASSMCKEIYTDGSLAQHRDAAELTTFLGETTERLERSTQSTFPPVSEETKNVIEVSKKCSAIANELLAELRKLQAEPEGSLLQAIKKGTRAMRRKGVIKETEKKLRKYQDILNTRILSKLDAHAVQQNVKFETLDQNVKDLTTQLIQNQDAFSQSLTNQTVALRTQLDRRLDNQVHTEAMDRMKQQFKDSLFFPEMFARQDDIPKSHEGTCYWIFDPSQVNPIDYSDGKDPDKDYPAPPWDSFTTWLGNDEDIYWLSGKPGSGKSTLMKYITSEFHNFCRSGVTLPGWGTGSDLVMCAFFFWTLGSSLQKNYVGFLRSLLYQIAEQREDLISSMMGQDSASGEQTSYLREPVRMYAWTKERLDDALKRFLSSKPSSISVCFFIDGLDEFVGDEDLLLETLRLLSGTPRVHVCVSSRPEQIYRQGFAQSPQLKLQHLNHQDIKKTVKDRLGATLTEKFPHLPEVVGEFVNDVIFRSEGIFLWTELIIKDLQRGARNSDDLQELRERFDRIPDTIEGLYQHMLGRLEKPYLREAAKYFQILMLNADFEDLGLYSGRTLTLLHCACAEETAWNKVLSHDVAYFQSPEFHESCRNLETRILTRCTGLVEIAEHREEELEAIFHMGKELSPRRAPISQEASNVSCFLREMRFIHKTVIEFLQTQKEFFHDPDWRITAFHTITRGTLGVLSLTPIIICKDDVISRPLKIDAGFVMHLVSGLQWTEVLWPPQLSRQFTRDIATEAVGQVYEILGYVNEDLNGAGYSLHDFLVPRDAKSSRYIPIHDCVRFAAYFGQHEYISTYIAQTDLTSKDVEEVLLCTLSGFGLSYMWDLDLALGVQGYCKIVTVLLKYSRDLDVYTKTAASAFSATRNSKWAEFLESSLLCINYISSWTGKERGLWDPRIYQQFRHSIVLWKDTIAYFLEHDADVNTRLYVDLLLVSSGPSPPDIDSDGYRISFTASETLLSWVGRTFFHPELRKEVECMVASHGGQHRRTILAMNIDEEVYPLTQEQSDRLLRAWVLEDGSLPRAICLNAWCGGGVGIGKKFSLIPPTSPDPTTEHKLTILLDNIDMFKVTIDTFDVGRYRYFHQIDFGDGSFPRERYPHLRMPDKVRQKLFDERNP